MEEQKELYKELFYRYGYYEEQANTKQINIFCMHPNSIHTTEEIEKRIKNTDKDIEKLQKYIDMLQDLKKQYVKQYNYIITSPTKTKYKITRSQNYYTKKITYSIIKYIVNLDNGHEEQTEIKTYTGKERNQAIKDFEKIKEQNPTFLYEYDIIK